MSLVAQRGSWGHLPTKLGVMDGPIGFLQFVVGHGFLNSRVGVDPRPTASDFRSNLPTLHPLYLDNSK